MEAYCAPRTFPVVDAKDGLAHNRAMAVTKYLKCLCAHCGGHIEFPAEGVGLTAPCPHCGRQTELSLEIPQAAVKRRSLKWFIAGVVILAIGIIAVVSALFVAESLAKKSHPSSAGTRPDVSAPRSSATSGSAVPARAKRADPINGFVASTVKIEKSPGSSLVYASGTLKNETEKQRFEVTIEIDLFDSTERKVGAAKDYKDVIEQRGQWTFRALVVQKNVVSARIAAIREQL